MTQVTDPFAKHNAAVNTERQNLEREVRKAIAVLGVARVLKLSSEHADARSMEACNRVSQKMWKGVFNHIEKALKLFERE